ARYQEAAPEEKSALLAEGKDRAVRRRAAMIQLIREDPQQALARAVSPRTQELLPLEIRDQLEEHFDSHGDFEVTLVCDDADSANHTHQTDSVSRHLTLTDHRLDAFVFGRREPQPTIYDIPVHGIRLDDVAALAESPVRVIADSSKTNTVRLQL